MSPNPTVSPTFDDLRFGPDGLIAAIVQQAGAADSGVPAGRVLMFAWMNRESLERTLATRKMHYWSRSRQKLWLKGETSGNTQELVSWYRDCDGDALLFVVRQTGGACHTGYESCFFQGLNIAAAPEPVAEAKRFDPAAAYGAASA
jgi:phosphoribosyl-AMP cyclohydrolase